MEGIQDQLVDNIDIEHSGLLVKLLAKAIITGHHYRRLRVNSVTKYMDIFLC